ncbi:MAG: NTP transferase domain-containing protein [Chloroflexota bacterium]
MSSSPVIGAIVLAAGGSSRLGQPKQLLAVGGQPLLQHTLNAVRECKLDHNILVLGAASDAIIERIETEDFTVVMNPDYRSGQSTSLRAALDALDPDAAGVVVFLGDQPLVDPMIVSRLVRQFDPDHHAAVRPRYSDGPGNPVLLGKSIFHELLQLSGDIGARDVLHAHRSRILDVDANERMTPADVDTEDDYEALLRDWASLGAPEIPRYCQRCGDVMHQVIRHDLLRPVCPSCNFTYFADPKVVVAAVIEIDGQVVMLRRKTDPGRGKWTIPSGFVDRGEPVDVAVRREVEEEVGLTIEQPVLFQTYSEPGDQVVLIAYGAELDGVAPIVGDEADRVGLFAPDDLPELAFPRDERIIRDWIRQRTQAEPSG